MLKKITIAGMAVMLTATPLMELSRIGPIGNIGYAEAAPKVKDKNVTVSNVEITSIKGAVTKENPVTYDKPINVSFTMNIDNSLKNLKAGAKTTIDKTVSGKWGDKPTPGAVRGTVVWTVAPTPAK